MTILEFWERVFRNLCMKREELSHNYYNEEGELRRAVADYVDFFNNMRPHQKLGMRTPGEAERGFRG